MARDGVWRPSLGRRAAFRAVLGFTLATVVSASKSLGKPVQPSVVVPKMELAAPKAKPGGSSASPRVPAAKILFPGVDDPAMKEAAAKPAVTSPQGTSSGAAPVLGGKGSLPPEHLKMKAQVMEELDAFHSDPEYRFLRGLAEDESDKTGKDSKKMAEAAEKEEMMAQGTEQAEQEREASLEARVAEDGARVRGAKNAGGVKKEIGKSTTAAKGAYSAERRTATKNRTSKNKAGKKTQEAIPNGAGTKTIPKEGLPEQGYNGAGMPKDTVTHDDLNSEVEDWHAEYPRAPRKKAENNSAGGLGLTGTPKSIHMLAMVAVALYVF